LNGEIEKKINLVKRKDKLKRMRIIIDIKIKSNVVI
jgi:hypothetical protein